MDGINIEFCCTGNQCRSVMAEAFARRAAERRGLDVTVSSSGLLPGGRGAPDEVLDVLGRRDLDVTAHRSRTLDAEIVAHSDLIIGMERRHLTEVVTIDADAWTRTFTLAEFVRRSEALGLEPAEHPGLGVLLESIGATRTRRDLLRVGGDDEIADPMGRSVKVFERTADRIADLVDRLVEIIRPAAEGAPVGVA